MQVREIMSRDIICCRPDSKLQDVAKMMLDCDCGAVPVADDAGKPIGMVTDRDIVCRLIAQGRNPLDATAKDVMSRDVATCRPEDSIEECENLMEQRQVRRIPVVDATGRCCGIVAQADIARKAPPEQTAEVVRDISQPSHQAAAYH